MAKSACLSCVCVCVCVCSCARVRVFDSRFRFYEKIHVVLKKKVRKKLIVKGFYTYFVILLDAISTSN